MCEAGVPQRFVITRLNEAAISGNERSSESAGAFACCLVDGDRKVPAHGGEPEASFLEGAGRRAQGAIPAPALHIAHAAKLFEPGPAAEIILPVHEGPVVEADEIRRT